jgi:hypothetical protein
MIPAMERAGTAPGTMEGWLSAPGAVGPSVVAMAGWLGVPRPASPALPVSTAL